MTPDRFPDAVSDGFEPPPVEFTDREDRRIEIRAYDGSDAERDALATMYDAFDPSDRAQGIPPSQPDAVRDWLDTILGGDCHNVIAWNGEQAAGHATLVPESDATELAIFVHQRFQKAGIGTRLIETLLGHGEAHDVKRVWLTVERWNRAAVALYEKIGFETTNAESFELEMALRLKADDD